MDNLDRRARLKASNRRTGLWLAFLALLFFALLFVKRIWLG